MLMEPLQMGKIYMASTGELFKTFDIKDGYGIKKHLKKYGIQTAIITGRKSEIVERRLCILETMSTI